jgi:hypothetical protein
MIAYNGATNLKHRTNFEIKMAGVQCVLALARIGNVEEEAENILSMN